MRRSGSGSDSGGHHSDHQDSNSARSFGGNNRKWTGQQPPPPPGREGPTADDAPTGRFQTPPPHRDPRGRTGGAEAGYERYNTAGYTYGQQHAAGDPTNSGGPGDRGDSGGTGAKSPPGDGDDNQQSPGDGRRAPRKMTVTRVAALRGRELSGQAVNVFQRAAKADGADRSGLTSLTYAVMLNYASDAAMAVALANTLFFAATSGESRSRVALYLIITLAPFALVAPVIGPALDKIQRGRRVAMCVASAGQVLMCVVMAMHFDSWLLYPAALGKLVLSKSFMVLKAAVTPRVVPPTITLSKTNARLTVFGLAAGGAFGAVASGFNWLAGAAGALWFTAAICGAGAVQTMRIPSWVEVTEGEVPASLGTHEERKEERKKAKRQPMAKHVVVALWGNGTIRVLTGFLMLFAAFAVKAQTGDHGPFIQLVLLGLIGGAAGAGGFIGNAIGSRLQFGKPDQVVLGAVASVLGATVLATILSGLFTAALVGLVGSAASALAKISLDAVIQHDMPEKSRASAFGRSETVLQLSWCGGGAIGLLLPTTWWIGFLVVSILLAFGLAQSWVVRGGGTIVPGLGGKRAAHPAATGPGQ